jgi:hypothetical protein
MDLLRQSGESLAGRVSANYDRPSPTPLACPSDRQFIYGAPRRATVQLGRHAAIARYKGGEAMLEGIASDTCLGERSTGTRDALRVASVGGDFSFGRHALAALVRAA